MSHWKQAKLSACLLQKMQAAGSPGQALQVHVLSMDSSLAALETGQIGY